VNPWRLRRHIKTENKDTSQVRRSNSSEIRLVKEFVGACELCGEKSTDDRPFVRCECARVFHGIFYDHDVKDVFSVEDEIADAIVASVRSIAG
jgi:hypothetical protein